MGTVGGWYDTLVDLIEKVMLEFDEPGFIVTSRDPHTILEHTTKFKSNWAIAPGSSNSTFSHGEFNFQESVLDPECKVSIYYFKEIPENAMYYVLDDGTHTPIHILD